MFSLRSSIHEVFTECASMEIWKDAIIYMDESIIEIARWSNILHHMIHTFQLHSLHLYPPCSIQKPRFDPFHLPPPTEIVICVMSFLHDMESFFLSWLMNVQHDHITKITICTTYSERMHAANHHSSSFTDIALKWTNLWNENKRELEKNSSCKKTIEIIHLPLYGIPMLDSSSEIKTNSEMKKEQTNDLPMLLLLASPVIKNAFPYTLSHYNADHLDASSRHVGRMEDLEASDLPDNIRDSYKMVAHSLAEWITANRWSVHERLFAIGSNSKILGHTIKAEVGVLKEDFNVNDLDTFTSASIILVDRTMDLVDVTKTAINCMDTILTAATAPQPSEDQVEGPTTLFPQTELYPRPTGHKIRSNLMSSLNWNGGSGVFCPPENENGNRILKSVRTSDVRGAIKALYTEIRALVLILAKEGKCSKPGKLPNERIRDTLTRWLSTITMVDKKMAWTNQWVFKLAVVLLETLEMKDVQYDTISKWETHFRELASLHLNDGLLEDLVNKMK